MSISATTLTPTFILFVLSEVVLFTLLEVFKFSVPTDLKEPIVWNVAGIQYPSVGYGSSKAELPLKVELLLKQTILGTTSEATCGWYSRR